MKGNNPPERATDSPVSGYGESRIETPARRGCEYGTPSGPCGSRGYRVTLGGVRVALCEPHVDDVIDENDLPRGAA